MRRSLLRILVPVLGLVLALALVACGGGKKTSTSAAGATGATTKAPAGAKKGGTLTMLFAGDVDFIDPGQAYYQASYIVDYAAHRTLYSYKPDNSLKPVPDLASGEPSITNGGKTVTIHIRSGIKFSPPVNRVVTSKDVKYAIERGFLPSVANGYADAYFGNLVGLADYKSGKAKDISGIQTPNDTTIVFQLTKGTGGVVAGALVLPLSAPVPQEYAAKFDAKNPSTYGTHQVATGPYMIQNDAAGNTTGYQPGKFIKLVRNPNWNASTDYRPAYLDAINIEEGNTNTEAAARKILDGSGLVSGDFPPPPAILKSALSANKDQVSLIPSGGNRYIALNTTVAPFNNINVRKAVIAASNRNALRLTRGGATVGDVATHFIPPGIPGFDEAGGMAGPGYDFLKNPNGDMKLAAEYMKKAGFPSGKYTGNQNLLMVADNSDPGAKTAQVALGQLQALGFKITFRQVTHSTMYTKYCNVPKADVAICPNVGWLKDFSDPQTILDPTFNGKNILQQNNSNWPQLNDPAINAAMAKAELLTDPAARAKAWGEIDKMVTAQAPAIIWIWDKQADIRSKDVNGVINLENATWDLNFTSLKTP